MIAHFDSHEQISVGSQLLCSLFEYTVSFAPLTWSYLALYSLIWHQKFSWNYASQRERPFQLLNSNAFSFKCSAPEVSVANSLSIFKSYTKTMVNDGEKMTRYWMTQAWKQVSQYSYIHFRLVGPPSKLPDNRADHAPSNRCLNPR